MDHANKAFLMAAGMLFALMILGMVAFVFSNLATLPNEEDVILEAKQVAEFNKEYLAYDKKIMYGVDIISVLNKAKSNNDKYVREDFVVGGGYNTDFIIDIEVVLDKSLTETVIVRHLKMLSNNVSEVEYMGGSMQEGPYKESSTNYYKMTEVDFNAPSTDYQKIVYGNENYWNNSMKFITNYSIGTTVNSGTYHIIGKNGETPVPGSYTNDMISKDTQKDNILAQIISQSATITQRISSDKLNSKVSPNGWSTAEWRPAVYDLKTRKFKCEGNDIVYSEKTGRIIKMKFVEV